MLTPAKIESGMRALITLFMVFLCVSCKEVYFTESQPAWKKPIRSIPEKFHGVYIELEGSDTLIVNKAGFFMSDFDGILSDTIQIKKFRKNYLLNMKEDQYGYWLVYMIQLIDEDNIRIATIDGEDEESIEVLKSITSVNTVMKNEDSVDYFVIGPSNKEFKKILNEGLFSSIVIYTRLKE